MNDQGVFEREKELCELFSRKEENKSVYISSNVSSEGIAIWVHFDKENNWDSTLQITAGRRFSPTV